MDKIKYPAVIVVEGTSDVAFLGSFLETEFVITNGSDVPRETIEYLKKIKEKKDIVVLTDPDYPGKRIRAILDEQIPGLLHAFVRKEKSIKHHKVGVAESTRGEVLMALSHIVPQESETPGTLTMSDLQDLGLMGGDLASLKRKKLQESLCLGFGNAKTLLRRLNALAITKEEIEEVLTDGE